MQYQETELFYEFPKVIWPIRMKLNAFQNLSRQDKMTMTTHVSYQSLWQKAFVLIEGVYTHG